MYYLSGLYTRVPETWNNLANGSEKALPYYIRPRSRGELHQIPTPQFVVGKPRASLDAKRERVHLTPSQLPYPCVPTPGDPVRHPSRRRRDG